MSKPPSMSDARQAWSAALGGAVALAIAMGIGRFVYTPLLPMMQQESGLTITGGGWLASANYLGYLIGALSCIRLTSRPELMIRLGLLLTVVLTLAMGLTQNFTLWLLLRLISGIASAWVFIHSSAWALRRLAATGQPRLAGVVYAGVGAGIFLTGMLCVLLVSSNVPASQAWLIFGGLALLASLFARFPAMDGPPRPAGTAAKVAGPRPSWDSATLRLLFAYGIAGFGYIIAATFLPLVAKQVIHSPVLLTLFWPLFGLSVVVVGVGTLWLPQSPGNRGPLAICLALQAIGNVALALAPNAAGLVIGTLLVGGVFTTVVQLSMREAQHLAGRHASWLMAALTSVYGVGQIIGPPLASYAVHMTGSFAWSLLIAAVALAAASLAAYPEILLPSTRTKGAGDALHQHQDHP